MLCILKVIGSVFISDWQSNSKIFYLKVLTFHAVESIDIKDIYVILKTENDVVKILNKSPLVSYCGSHNYSYLYTTLLLKTHQQSILQLNSDLLKYKILINVKIK